MNRVYEGDNFDTLYGRLCKDLINDPDFETTNRHGDGLREIVNPTIVLTEPSCCFAFRRKLSMKYLNGELAFYFSGSPYLKDIVKYSKFWNKVSDDGLTINSNYGRLLLFDRNTVNSTQYEYAKRCLKNNPDSKKAVMVIYNKDHARKSNDNPCTMYLQFILREGYLNLLVKMRSSDIWFGMPYDVPFFSIIQHNMAEELHVKVGQYIHNSGSLHLYNRNIDKVKESLLKDSVDKQEQRDIFEDLLYPEILKEDE